MLDYDVTGKWFTLAFPFADQVMTAAVAEIPGSKFYKPRGYWIAPKAAARHVNAWAKAHAAPISESALDAMQDMEQLEANVDKSKARKPIYPGQNYGMAVELFDYQKAGVEYILGPGGGRVIVGDEMGVGKTLQAIAAVAAQDGDGPHLPAVIICPASLKVNWKREIQKAAPGTSIEILRGEKGQPRLWHADWTIVNYNILEAWEPYLPDAPQAVIADESQYIMNPQVSWTRATLRVFNTCPGIRLCMSGTAVLNKTTEIMTQIEAIGRLSEVGDGAARRTWKGRGAELNKHMRGSGMYLRRLKADVWKDAPGRRWAPFIVEGDPKAMREYKRAEANFGKWLADKVRNEARAAGATSQEAQDAAWVAVMKAQAAEILVQFSYLKRLAAIAKMPAVKEWVKNFAQQDGQKLAAFAWHTEIVDEMTARHPELKPLKIVGGQTERQRQTAVDLFQKNKSHRLIVGQIKAAGVGLTLTAASNVLLVEQGWTPGAHDQVLDRCHRRGQTDNVVGWVPLCEGTIDEDIFALVEAKRTIVDSTLDGWDRTAGDVSEMTVAEELAEKFFKKSIDPKLRE